MLDRSTFDVFATLDTERAADVLTTADYGQPVLESTLGAPLLARLQLAHPDRFALLVDALQRRGVEVEVSA